MAFESLKYKLLLKRKLFESKEIAKMSKLNNDTLNLFLQSYISVKNQTFEVQDLKAFGNVNAFRQNLLNDQTVVSYEIFGTTETNIVSNICKIAASTEKWGQLLYLIAKKIDAPKVLEIGTNLGISGSYILEAIATKKDCKFITMEGVETLCEIASSNFKTIVDNTFFEVLQGLYDTTFPKLLKKEILFNLFFIDGNHSKKPTIEYFEALKSKTKTPSIFIFDDIHWSKGMTQAWSQIKNDPMVTCSIDLYKWGIIILDGNGSLKNQHFSLPPLSM